MDSKGSRNCRDSKVLQDKMSGYLIGWPFNVLNKMGQEIQDQGLNNQGEPKEGSPVRGNGHILDSLPMPAWWFWAWTLSRRDGTGLAAILSWPANEATTIYIFIFTPTRGDDPI